MSSDTEQELKLTPIDPRLLDQLNARDALGPFRVIGRRAEQQRNSFFDSPSGGLSDAHVGFRRRTVRGQTGARWSLKGDSQLAVKRGIATRAEIEVQLDADTPPLLALGVLRQAARQRGAAALAEQVSDGLAAGGMPFATPYLETETNRQIVDLQDEARGWRVELALDRVRLVGHTYEEVEIEAELVEGDELALEEARQAIEGLGDVHESQGSKLSRAHAHLRECDCR